MNNTVSKNRITGPGLWGILMGAGAYNVFHDNSICNYTGSYDGYGIAIGGNHLVAEHNTFYRNILTNNNKHVGAGWEILGAGNYWDDYNGTDANGDGIGDSPYTVEGPKWDDTARGHICFVFGQDNYPLMSPFDIDNESFESPEKTPSSSDTLSIPEIPNPFPAIAVTAALTAAIAVSAGLLFYFKKHTNNPKAHSNPN